MNNVIDQFMWGYQQHFRAEIRSAADSALAHAGVPAESEVILVGVLASDAEADHDVCVEPENDQWDSSLFGATSDRVKTIIVENPMQRMFYGDEATMADKPENIRRSSVSQAVGEALLAFDNVAAVRSIVGQARRVGKYYVVPVLQLAQRIIDRVPSLKEPIGDGRFSTFPSFAHCIIEEVLAEATRALERPEPGRRIGERLATVEVLRRAATNFMYSVVAAIGGPPTRDLFVDLNKISSLFYESRKSEGTLLLATANAAKLDAGIQFREAISLHQPRWIRKALELAIPGRALICDGENAIGVAAFDSREVPGDRELLHVRFRDHYHWELWLGLEILLSCEHGAPRLKPPLVEEDLFRDNFERIFGGEEGPDGEVAWALVESSIGLGHGCMLVFSVDAESEANRLKYQGTSIRPLLFSPALLASASSIDGTIILDPQCRCHAIGVILDGSAVPECTPARGARYNSGVRYVAGCANRLAVVVSEDGSIDFMPRLRPRVRRSEVAEMLDRFESASLETYHEPRLWLDRNRFYLDEAMCIRANAALERIQKLPLKVGQIRIHTRNFVPSKELNDSYFVPE